MRNIITKTTTPPSPPKPKQTTALTAHEKAAAIEKLIKQIQGEGKFKNYSWAREEARRRKPELFA